ncbi:hypothetical protein KSS87_011282 [Heliosperma pusillum]|nr:hypothetical protein KSS87_012337 [Heliosperma pusillum]KAH9623038.1 hypothetical protein KSS87_011282 [Heliosperma pusillum]
MRTILQNHDMLDGGPMEFQVRYNANAALEYLNKQEGGQEYELVEPGPVYGATISRGPILHFNFLAKLKDRPDAQVETFFAQLRMYTGLVIDLCVSLGPSEALPHWGNADVTGCRYCGRLVHHPREKCEKLLWGVMGEDTYWLYDINILWRLEEPEKGFLKVYLRPSQLDLDYYLMSSFDGKVEWDFLSNALERWISRALCR